MSVQAPWNRKYLRKPDDTNFNYKVHCHPLRYTKTQVSLDTNVLGCFEIFKK